MIFLTHCWSLFNEQEKAEIQDTWASTQDMRSNNLDFKPEKILKIKKQSITYI